MSINNIPHPLSRLKQLFVKKARQPYKVRFGLFRNLILNMDLQYEMQVYSGLFERETYKFIQKAACSCEWMIDIGAGKGELCLYFLKNSHAEKIFAFEPQERETDIIKHNIVLNGEQNSQRIVVSNKYVGTSTDINFVSLDSVELDWKKRGFIKIDVSDGFEMDVLRSGASLLSEGNVDLLVETHSKQLEYECVEWLRSKGYSCKIIKNAWWRLIIPEQRPLPHNRWLWATRA